MLVDHWATPYALGFKNKYQGEYAEANIKGKKVGFLKPQTFMNLSGKSVQAALSDKGLKITQTLVLHDELDIPFGECRLKDGGGAGGHNGLRSIIECCGKDFLRFRMGIGRPLIAQMPVDRWVLGNFSKEEYPSVENMLKGSSSLLEVFFEKGLSETTKQFNTKSALPNKQH